MNELLLIDKCDSLTLPDAALLADLLEASSFQHRHLCPRQVLGVRMGLYGLRVLGLSDLSNSTRFTNERKRLLTIVETDGCGATGVTIATDCHIGRRTLRVVDYGKMAATLVDTRTGRAVRIAPQQEVRQRVRRYAPDAGSRWHAYLTGYQLMPDEELLRVEVVELNRPLAEIISRPGVRALCQQCGEEIINEREVLQGGRLLCRACAGEAYYSVNCIINGSCTNQM